MNLISSHAFNPKPKPRKTDAAADAELANANGKKLLEGAPGAYNKDAMKRVIDYRNHPAQGGKLNDWWNWWKRNVESKELSEFLKPFENNTPQTKIDHVVITRHTNHY